MSTAPELYGTPHDDASESVDPLLTKVCTIYSALKATLTESDRHSTDLAACKRYRDANSLNVALNNAQKGFKRDWRHVSPEQRLLLLDLLLGYYCRSRRGDDVRAHIWWSSMCDQIGFGPRTKALDKCLEPDHVPLATAERQLASVETFLHLLGILYTVPLDDREFSAFTQSRKAISMARRLRLANGVRCTHLERVEAAQRLLHDRAMVPPAANGAQRTALAFFFGRLRPADQAAVVESAREFLYTACLERAAHGRALDPVPPIHELFGALRSPELDSAWRCELVSHDLTLIVHFYRAHGAPVDVVESLADLLAAKKSSWSANLFPRLPVATQQQAVSHCRKLLLDAHTQWESQQTNPDGARMYAEFLALLAPWELRPAAHDAVAHW
ncbi:hypothetical protein JCM8208_005868 [Rhodotorula glutinis]